MKDKWGRIGLPCHPAGWQLQWPVLMLNNCQQVQVPEAELHFQNKAPPFFGL